EQQARQGQPPPERRAAPGLPRRPADYPEHPGAKARAPTEARPAVQDLQVACLKHILRRGTVPAAARERPAERRGVQLLELGGEVLRRHTGLGLEVWQGLKNPLKSPDAD